MIGYLKGEILEVDFKSNKIIVLINGVGYLVTVSTVLLSEHSQGEKIELFIEPEIREDTFDLFGFTTVEEKQFYKKIRSVNGVGPRTALNILSLKISDLEEAIEAENVKKLCTVPGLGKKTAERLILELKGNLPSRQNDVENNTEINQDIMQALMNLGYKSKDISEALKDLPSNVQGDQEIIKYFLQNLK